MVRPPDADPVSAARMLVATASETSGPPSIASTQSRTIVNAGSEATTAPNPTRLATLNAGSTDALAPASMVCRSAGRRAQFSTMVVTMAAVSATATDHTPATAASDRLTKTLLGEIADIEPRQHHERHHEIDDDDDDQRRIALSTGDGRSLR